MSVCLKKNLLYFPLQRVCKLLHSFNVLQTVTISCDSVLWVREIRAAERKWPYTNGFLFHMIYVTFFFTFLFSIFFFLVIIVLICCAICKILMLKLFVKLRENNTTVQGSHINIGRRRRRSLFPWQWSWPPSCEIQRPRRRMTLHVVSCQRRFSDSNISNDIWLWVLICRK